MWSDAALVIEIGILTVFSFIFIYFNIKSYHYDYVRNFSISEENNEFQKKGHEFQEHRRWQIGVCLMCACLM